MHLSCCHAGLPVVLPLQCKSRPIRAAAAPLKGLSESTVRRISTDRSEPQWLLNFRLDALNHLLSLPQITDLQSISYLSEPQHKPLPDPDPLIVDGFLRFSVVINKEKRPTKSIFTSRIRVLENAGGIFCSITDAVEQYPHLVRKYLGRIVPANDNYHAALNSAVFTDGFFCYMPWGCSFPIEISSRFRTTEPAPFERTLIVADELSTVNYLEGCTGYEEKQLHAAVVELFCHDRAEINYSTVKSLCAEEDGVYNSVTKRGICDGPVSKISWTQVERSSSNCDSMRPNTRPYTQVKNYKALVAVDVNTSKIGEDQLLKHIGIRYEQGELVYFKQRGNRNEQDVTAMIGGFSKEVFNETSQEFSSEAGTFP